MKRSEFHIPAGVTYLCGNSLGLPPKAAIEAVQRDMDKWSTLAVDGHFAEPEPWLHAESTCARAFLPIVGAQHEHEVAIMGELSANIHFLLSAFYRPTGGRYKILVEEGAFPSDIFVVRSFLENRNAPDDTLLLLPVGEYGLYKEESIKEVIREHAKDLALVFLGGVNFYTGQVLPIHDITKQCHQLVHQHSKAF